MSFKNSRNTDVYGGSFKDVHGDLITHYHGSITVNHRNDALTHYDAVNRPEAGIYALYNASSLGAAFDSHERDPPPRCHPGTRELIVQNIFLWMEAAEVGGSWAELEEDGRADRASFIRGTKTGSEFAALFDPTARKAGRVLWIHGAAGAGKSALAQTISESCADAGKLAASFFFSRGIPTRDSAKHFFLTIAFQLATTIPGLRSIIAKSVESDISIVSKSLEMQLRRLIIEPFRALPPTTAQPLHRKPPFLIVIDGLDECGNHEAQSHILTLLGVLINVPSIPLCFIIVSRPEPHILASFSLPAFQHTSRRISLHGSHRAKDDVHRFLRASFERIHNSEKHSSTMRAIPKPWPSARDMQHLVEKSGGYFIYASTVLKFVDQEFACPVDQLELVLKTSGSNATAFAELDKLYRQILSINPNRSLLVRILAYIVVDLGFTPSVIEALLGLRRGEVLVMLRGLHSLLRIDTSDPNSFIESFHASFPDFLFDKDRAKEFYINQEIYHTDIAHTCLAFIGNWKSTQKLYPNVQLDIFENWVYHFARAGDQNRLLGDLRALDVSVWQLILRDTDNNEDFDDASRAILHMLDDAIWELRHIHTTPPNDLIQQFINLRDFICRHKVSPKSVDDLKVIQKIFTIFHEVLSLDDIIRLLELQKPLMPLHWIGYIKYIDYMRHLEVDVYQHSAYLDDEILKAGSVGFINDRGRSKHLFSEPTIRHARLARYCMRLLIVEWSPEFEDRREYKYARRRWVDHLSLSSIGDKKILSLLRNNSIHYFLDELYFAHLLQAAETWQAQHKVALVPERSANEINYPDSVRALWLFHPTHYCQGHWNTQVYDWRSTFRKSDLANAKRIIEWLKKTPDPPQDILSTWETYHNQATGEPNVKPP